MLKKLILPITGLCAGFINGLLGTGGGEYDMLTRRES